MIYGNIYSDFYNEQLKILPEPLAGVVDFLKNTDFSAYKQGSFYTEICGTNVIVQVWDMDTGIREALRPEIHRKNVDIQFLYSGGPEKIGFFADRYEHDIDEDLLSTDRDILFYRKNDSDGEGKIFMERGSYAVFFPWDVHIPSEAAYDKSEKIRKIVVKLPLTALI